MKVKAKSFKRLGPILMILGFICLTSGQTVNDFEKRFGLRSFYEIRPKIQMLAQFNKDGQVCRVSFQPTRISEKTKTNYLGEGTLDIAQLKEAFDEIVPIEQRQGKIKSNGGFIISGGMFFGSLNYENLTIGLNGTWRGSNKEAQIDFCELFGKKLKDDNKFNTRFCSMFGSLDVVTVDWTKRNCNKN